MNYVRKVALYHNGPQHRAILMPWFSNFLRNSTNHFRMFLYLVTCFLSITVSLLYRLQAVSKIHVQIYPNIISEGRRNCSNQDKLFRAIGPSNLWPAQQRNPDSQETCYQIQTHEKMDCRKLSENLSHGIKIPRVNSIRITKSMNFTLIL